MNILHTALIISFASLGFRAITGKNMILYFLRKPFDTLSDRKKRINETAETAWKRSEEIEELIPTLDGSDLLEYKKEMDLQYSIHAECMADNPEKHDWLLYIMKPFLLCSTCMASVHTLVWWYVMDFEWDYRVILVMLIVAFLNTLGWAIVELIQKYSK